MWKILFTWKDFWPVPVAFAACFLLCAGAETSPLMVLLGIVCAVWALFIFIQMIVNRIKILLSPDYEAMKADLSDAESFLGRRVYLGKEWLYSSYYGKMYRCKDVRSLEQKVSRPPRSTATARLTAWVNGEGRVILAGYDYSGKNISQAAALMQALERRQRPADEPEAGNPDPAPSAETESVRPEEAPPQTQVAPEPSGEPDRSAPPVRAEAPAEVWVSERDSAEAPDTPTSGSGERFEDYVCNLNISTRAYLFLAGLFDMLPLMFILPLCLSAHRGWLAVPITVIVFFVTLAALKLTDRRREKLRKERIFEDFDTSGTQEEFDAALRNSADTLRLGKNVLFGRGLGSLLPYRNILRIQWATVRGGSVLRMDVYNGEKVKTIDLNHSLFCFTLREGRTMSTEEFEAFLRKRCPSLQVGVPVIDR